EEPLALSPNNPYIKNKNYKITVETATTEPFTIGIELDKDTKMEPVISETEITIISSNTNQISEVS
ncbi:13219_t:CDS:1, partial [Ambispora leptoticha]